MPACAGRRLAHHRLEDGQSPYRSAQSPRPLVPVGEAGNSGYILDLKRIAKSVKTVQIVADLTPVNIFELRAVVKAPPRPARYISTWTPCTHNSRRTEGR